MKKRTSNQKYKNLKKHGQNLETIKMRVEWV